MKTIDIIFDGEPKAWVDFDDALWRQAEALVPGTETASKKKERVVVAKMLQLGYAGRIATNDAWDIELQQKNSAEWRFFDIKTLYPDHGAAGSSISDRLSSLCTKAESEFAKEIKQGAFPLFDLSYLPADVGGGVEAYVLGAFTMAMTLRYSHKHKRYGTHNNSIYLNGRLRDL